MGKLLFEFKINSLLLRSNPLSFGPPLVVKTDDFSFNWDFVFVSNIEFFWLVLNYLD